MVHPYCRFRFQVANRPSLNCGSSVFPLNVAKGFFRFPWRIREPYGGADSRRDLAPPNQWWRVARRGRIKPHGKTDRAMASTLQRTSS